MSDPPPPRPPADPVREEIRKESVHLAFAVATIVAYVLILRVMGDPDFLTRLRIRYIDKPRPRNGYAEAITQVRKEISLLEHGEM